MFLIFLFSFLFACNTSSLKNAYNDYYKYQQLYIEALLDNNKEEKIKALKGIIECSKFLNKDYKEYQEKLNKLLPKKKFNFIKIISLNPLTLSPAEIKKHFFLKRGKYYKEVIDLKGAIRKRVFKKFKNYGLIIAQYDKNTVRIVFYSTKPFKLKKIKNATTLTLIYPTKTKIAKKKKKRVIVIDPGHGGIDAGGVGIKRIKEKDIVLKVALKLKNILQKMGYRVYLTRYSDRFIKLKNRTHFANRKKADLFISLHCNIAPRHHKAPRGVETYFLSPNRSERAIRVARFENKEIKGLNYLDQRVILGFLNRDRIIESNKFAIDVQKNILKEVRKRYYIKDGGVRPGPFWVLVGTQMPAILIEMGYLTNPIEAKLLKKRDYQTLIARGIAKGIKAYFDKNFH